MDDLDERLITLLRHDGRRSISDLAADLGVSRATARARLAKLERAGDILGYTVILRADVPNPAGKLVDGQLVRVELTGRTPEERIVIPQAALIADQAGLYVFAVEDGKAVVRRVKVGGNQGANVVVTEGVKAGEPVIISGFESLRPGVAVRAVPATTGVKG